MAKATEIRYIRFGELPVSGRSYNHTSKHAEAGISCYKVVRINGTWRVDAAWGSFKMLATSKIPMYEIAGTELSERGSDGEALLSDARIVRRSRMVPVGDCWDQVYSSGISRIYRHALNGELWCALNGIPEERGTVEQIVRHISTFDPQNPAIAQLMGL